MMHIPSATVSVDLDQCYKLQTHASLGGSPGGLIIWSATANSRNYDVVNPVNGALDYKIIRHIGHTTPGNVRQPLLQLSTMLGNETMGLSVGLHTNDGRLQVDWTWMQVRLANDTESVCTGCYPPCR